MFWCYCCAHKRLFPQGHSESGEMVPSRYSDWRFSFFEICSGWNPCRCCPTAEFLCHSILHLSLYGNKTISFSEAVYEESELSLLRTSSFCNRPLNLRTKNRRYHEKCKKEAKPPSQPWWSKAAVNLRVKSLKTYQDRKTEDCRQKIHIPYDGVGFLPLEAPVKKGNGVT